MKKLIFLLVILAFSVSGAYSASIVNSAHDLSGSSTFASATGGTQYGSTDTDRLCVFCHTPHYALTAAPLWNRNSDDLSGATPYDSSTFDFAPDYTTGDVPLCMSCHDGDMTDSLVNLNAAPSGALTADAGNSRSLSIPGASPSLLGTDFTNDHPVGFEYVSATDAQGGLEDETSDADVQALLRGTNEVWCASCHNVHDPGDSAAGTAPFLRVSNTNSALCLTCHIK